ncbi:hypothetical protein IGI04_006192 [Brassica rapa subsp. trilocularis]|uniref:Uncharacterized protein n=1 Tax=Brassica rapa subsp. trilocularis TaxID=1813537 RepID=A0ABQ7NGM2_BRACM|nr:hypothetical protein IGI04_006192 [Brassica rapa subsp. trilocularis]
MKRFRPRVNQSLSSLSFSTSSPRLLQKLEFEENGGGLTNWTLFLVGGGLRTGASCSWDLEKICNWFAVKGPVRSSSAKLSLRLYHWQLRFLSVTEPALLGDGGDKGRTYRLSVLEPLLRDALAVNSDGRYLTTRGVDRHVHKCQGVHLRLGEIESCNYTRKVDKAEKLDEEKVAKGVSH